MRFAAVLGDEVRLSPVTSRRQTGAESITPPTSQLFIQPKYQYAEPKSLLTPAGKDHYKVKAL